MMSCKAQLPIFTTTDESNAVSKTLKPEFHIDAYAPYHAAHLSALHLVQTILLHSCLSDRVPLAPPCQQV